jgi:PilZ domain
MNSTVVRERRAAQRFNFNLPLSVRNSGNGLEGNGFTQDLSARGVFFYTDVPLHPGESVELTLKMPSEITLGESMRVRCQAQVVRANQAESGCARAVAVLLQNYEYLPDAEVMAEPARDFSRVSALHEEDTAEPENGLAGHTFQWRGASPLVPR